MRFFSTYSVKLINHLSHEEKNIGFEPVELGLRWPDNSAKIPRILVQLDEDRIFQAATDYQRWTNGTYVFENLPRFENAIISGLTLEDENAMIKKEIAKYAEFARSDKPPLFKSNGILGTTNPEGFQDLAKVLDQIETHLQVINHDNYLLILEHFHRYDFYRSFKQARDLIRERYQREPHGTIRINGREPKRLDDEANNIKVYHALVDFVFKCLAWWLMHIAKNDSWNAHIIAVMARWAVKLKFIALDPVHWVEKALAKGEDVMRQIQTEQEDEDWIKVKIPHVNSGEEGAKVVFPDDPNLAASYYESKSHFRDILLQLVNGMLSNLNTRLLGSDSVALPVRTLIYRDGLNRTLRQLAVHQNGQISTTSDGEEFRYSHTAFQLLVSNSQRIVNCDPEAPNVANVCWHHIVKGEVSPIYRAKGEKRTDQLDDIISLLVPLSFMKNSDMVEQLHSALAWTIAYKDPDSQKLDRPREETLELEFSITTPKKIGLPTMIHSDTIPSSQSPLFTGLEGNSLC
ncbi:hypothetical protein P152DRAFT_305397 [Eremomyces bilateralis CBS 781.70]|uniref:Uncharacterized protein n=1 Tax=Eremomyces bilateralis CBS 781.70 TaxID=1392243 RepID=A0A6G1FQ75_9PEZI|nr:uncharacterized protein P152DRAFT_305542 [Eremomyces bilateralis CBS 781.70]XP_033529472.1 uncharacterized protein P152DRAFT_305397 [Eremomyces bilateralis CBS 781.70]KAF1807838.1 hypothetical protein P152DRAFT_305542 [Eremomyces bilateralis CBS 781.70]KAF1807841.1 hypothetical protein P152DRAFT_305397 [Eremomyces bilateralis CBS 781.70]